jgi:hypothetical protein
MSGARTVAATNILLTSLGRTEPVYSIARTRHTAIKQRWWQCTVRIDLTGGHQLTYRARGIRRPTKLARIFRRNPAEQASAPTARRPQGTMDHSE